MPLLRSNCCLAAQVWAATSQPSTHQQPPLHSERPAVVHELAGSEGKRARLTFALTTDPPSCLHAGRHACASAYSMVYEALMRQVLAQALQACHSIAGRLSISRAEGFHARSFKLLPASIGSRIGSSK